MTPEQLARRREIDAKNAREPFPAANIRHRRRFVPYTKRSYRVQI